MLGSHAGCQLCRRLAPAARRQRFLGNPVGTRIALIAHDDASGSTRIGFLVTALGLACCSLVQQRRRRREGRRFQRRYRAPQQRAPADTRRSEAKSREQASGVRVQLLHALEGQENLAFSPHSLITRSRCSRCSPGRHLGKVESVMHFGVTNTPFTSQDALQLGSRRAIERPFPAGSKRRRPDPE